MVARSLARSSRSAAIRADDGRSATAYERRHCMVRGGYRPIRDGERKANDGERGGAEEETGGKENLIYTKRRPLWHVRLAQLHPTDYPDDYGSGITAPSAPPRDRRRPLYPPAPYPSPRPPPGRRRGSRPALPTRPPPEKAATGGAPRRVTAATPSPKIAAGPKGGGRRRRRRRRSAPTFDAAVSSRVYYSRSLIFSVCSALETGIHSDRDVYFHPERKANDRPDKFFE